MSKASITMKVEPETATAIRSTDRFYQDHAMEYFERTVGADMSPLRDRFLSQISPGGKILDAGCGSGRDLAVFFRRGFLAVGLDASPALVQLAREYSGAPCFVGRIEEIDYENHFDGIWACASLLHFPRTMLVSTLCRLHRALVPGGTLFAAVQEGDGELHATDGRFFSYYHLPEFAEAIRSADFAISDAFTTSGVLAGRKASRWINVFATR